MKIDIPNELDYLKSFKFNELCILEFMNFSIEMLLPSLFYYLESDGKLSNKKNDNKLELYFPALENNEKIVGFSNEKLLLEKWVKTSILQMQETGKSHNKGEVISYLKPNNYLTFKSLFPKEETSLRSIPAFILSLLNYNEDNKTSYNTFRNGLKMAFSKNLARKSELNVIESDYELDNQNNIDTEALLSICFLESFQKVEFKKEEIQSPKPVCTGQGKLFVKDICVFITYYYDKMSTKELMIYLSALINVHLFVYTLKLAQGIADLVEKEKIPVQFSDQIQACPPFIFCDLMDKNDSFSRKLSKSCVESDIRLLDKFISYNIYIKLLYSFCDEEYAKEKGIAYPNKNNNVPIRDYLLQLLLISKDNVDFNADAKAIIKKLITTNSDGNKEIVDENISDYFEQKNKKYGTNSIKKVCSIIEDSIKQQVDGSINKWYKDSSGLNISKESELKDIGILAGSTRHKTTWFYTLKNDLLWTLVHLACAHHANNEDKKPSPIRLIDFLAFLKNQYGILIHEVPPGMESVENHEAASANLLALQNKLRQMGLFKSLTDDFDAQFITPQYINVN